MENTVNAEKTAGHKGTENCRNEYGYGNRCCLTETEPTVILKQVCRHRG